ncbi:MAG: cupin [Pseudolabrys sp.]|nr:cupin [Pseudolabrys sp.]
MRTHKIEPIKRLLENATGIAVPTEGDARRSVRNVKPTAYRFAADGYIPNNRTFPLFVHRGAIRFDRRYDAAAIVERVFGSNGWKKAWRNGIYDFVHYHPKVFEVLGIARGSANVRLGGNRGTSLTLRAGDVIIIPPGVGHECLRHTDDFLVVGAYPPTGTYSECRGSYQEYAKAIRQIRRVPRPKKHPLYGRTRRLNW